MSLAYAQNLIETNWMDVYTSIGGSSGSSNSSGGSGSTAQQPKPTEIQPTSTPGGSGHPAGTSGQCVDGTYTEAKHKRGACSHHGGNHNNQSVIFRRLVNSGNPPVLRLPVLRRMAAAAGLVSPLPVGRVRGSGCGIVLPGRVGRAMPLGFCT
jgi:hypothetical protein